jgi:hypothetical protein
MRWMMVVFVPKLRRSATKRYEYACKTLQIYEPELTARIEKTKAMERAQRIGKRARARKRVTTNRSRRV